MVRGSVGGRSRRPRTARTGRCVDDGEEDRVPGQCLEAPAHGFERDGIFYAPRRSEILRELLARLNLARTRKAWLPVLAWAMVALLGAAQACAVRAHA